MPAPHEVLGVDEDADELAVEQAYRRRVKEAHPDHGGSPSEFWRVKEAYEALAGAERAEEAGSAPRDGPAASGGAGRPGGHPRGRTPRGATAGARAADGTPTPPAEIRVEYLDYAALTERGWSLDDDDLFEKAADAGLAPDAYGRFVDDVDGSLLESAEASGFGWPYSCRGGACANCAVALLDGELSMPANHVLPDELYDRGLRLSCIGTPATEELRVVYNVRHLPALEELLLPERPF